MCFVPCALLWGPPTLCWDTQKHTNRLNRHANSQLATSETLWKPHKAHFRQTASCWSLSSRKLCMQMQTQPHIFRKPVTGCTSWDAAVTLTPYYQPTPAFTPLHVTKTHSIQTAKKFILGILSQNIHRYRAWCANVISCCIRFGQVSFSWVW